MNLVMPNLKVPWRVAQWFEKQRLTLLKSQCDRLIADTPPLLTNAESVDFEVHSLLGRRHVGMCLWSIKSLLHFAGKQYRIILHDDGSLTEKNIRQLEHHLVNVKVIRKFDADGQVAGMLKSYPEALGYRFGTLAQTEWGRRLSVFSLKLLDFNLLATAAKILVLDTDVLFFSRPNEIIRWAEDPASSECLYCYDEYRPVRNHAGRLTGFDRKSEPQCYFNSGLICLTRSAFNLPVFNEWIAKNKGRVDTAYTFEQQAYNYLVHCTDSHSPLPAVYSFNYNDSNCIATHFGIKLLFFRNIRRVHKALMGLDSRNGPSPCQLTEG